MSNNWKIKQGELWVRDTHGAWLNERFAMMFAPDLYQQRLNEMV